MSAQIGVVFCRVKYTNRRQKAQLQNFHFGLWGQGQAPRAQQKTVPECGVGVRARPSGEGAKLVCPGRFLGGVRRSNQIK